MNPLASSYQTQITGTQGRSEWVVYSQDKKRLFSLPARLTELEVLSIIKEARKYESLAFNSGIEFQKGHAPVETKDLQTVVRNLRNENQILLKENEKLGDTLDRLTKGKF